MLDWNRLFLFSPIHSAFSLAESAARARLPAWPSASLELERKGRDSSTVYYYVGHICNCIGCTVLSPGIALFQSTSPALKSIQQNVQVTTTK